MKSAKAIGRQQDLLNDINTAEYFDCIKDIISSKVVLKMGTYKHHCDTTCLQHCINVSYYCYLICKHFGWDYRSAARAGLLHDLFLYDWTTHKKMTGESFHGLTHPRTAYYKAKKYFKLNKKEKDIILKHMWPITIIPPIYKESYVIVFVDKYCGTLEIADYYLKKLTKKIEKL